MTLQARPHARCDSCQAKRTGLQALQWPLTTSRWGKQQGYSKVLVCSQAWRNVEPGRTDSCFQHRMEQEGLTASRGTGPAGRLQVGAAPREICVCTATINRQGHAEDVPNPSLHLSCKE